MLPRKFRAGGSEILGISDPPLRTLRFSQKSQFALILKLSHRALGMSDFSDMGLIRQEIVHIFRILIKHGSHNYLHTCGTHKAHHAKNAIFVPVVCSSSCAWCAHILGGAHHLKVQHQGFPTPCPDLKSDKNSLL